MNNKRSYVYFLLCFLLTVTFCGKLNFAQAADYNDKGIKLDVNNNKSWVIKFNKELDNSTIDNSKFVVTDEGGQQIAVNVTIGADEKSVIVSPKNEYGFGKTYNLFIKDGIKSKSKNSLTKTAKMQFTVKNNSANASNKAYTVCIDAGHGGSDIGNVGQPSTKEKDVDLSVALKVGKILTDNGVNVAYTRKSDSISWSKEDDLKSRFDISNNAKADFFVSIHCNAVPNNPSANGIETYYSETDIIGQKLAQGIQDELGSNTGRTNRGIRVGQPQHQILTGTAATAVMVELGFLTNNEESSILGSEDFQNKSAESIANGILKSLKLVDKSKSNTITSIADLGFNVLQGESFTLPLSVTANMSDGTTKKVNVIWKDKTVNTTELGLYCYKGNVAGYNKEVTLNLSVVDKSGVPVQPPTSNITVCIDPGHGLGSDTGATGVAKLQEDDVTLAVGLKAGKILEDNGINVVYTRTTDMRSTPMSIIDSLQKRCDTSNDANATYFVSIHNNAVDVKSVSGTETWNNPGNSESEKLASNIQNNIVQQVGTNDRGLKDGYQRGLYVITHTNAPSVLVELAFLTNDGDSDKLRNDSYQQKFAQAIADGILQSLGKK